VTGQPIETRPPELATDRPAFPGQTRAPYRKTSPYRVTVLTDQLQRPWSLAFLPDGKMLVTEKPGRMRIVDATGKLTAPISGLPSVYYKGQVGLLDVVLDPRFTQNRRIFFSFNEPVGADDAGIAIARATFDEAALSLSHIQVIFRAKPALPKSLSSNAGGRLAIGPDRTLFATIGDRNLRPGWKPNSSTPTSAK
jgi:aldose sugar dehydrogenase